MAHTPGPWLASNRTVRTTHNGPEQHWKRHVHVADTLEVVATGIGATRDECFANAELIAAAPELADVVKRVVEAMTNPGKEWWCDLGKLRAIEADARAAIAKAEGRS